MNDLHDVLDSQTFSKPFDYISIIRDFAHDPNYKFEYFALTSSNKSTIYDDQINCEVLLYWKQRADTTSNIQLKALYANLIWKFKDVSRNCIDKTYKYAQIAVESYLFLLKNENFDGITLEMTEKEYILRSLEITKQIKFNEKLSEIAKIMLEIEQSKEDELIGLWGYCYDELISNKNFFTAEQEEKIINTIEQRYVRLIDNDLNTESDEFHAIMYAAEKLATYYFKSNNQEKIRSVLVELEKVIDQTIDNRLDVKEYRYTSLYILYESVQIVSENSRIMKKIQDASEQNMKNMKSITVEQTIDKKELELFASRFVTDNLESDIENIAVFFVPKIKEHERIIDDQIQDGTGILLDLFAHVKIDRNGIPINSLDMSIRENKLAIHIKESLSIKEFFLNYVLTTLFEKHTINEFVLTEVLIKSPIIIQENKELLSAALKAYFDGQYIAFMHIAIPFVESTLRNLIKINGQSIYKPNKDKGYDVILLGDILSNPDIANLLGEDLLFYMKLVYNDKRGLNLRNSIAHGLLSPSIFNKATSNLVLHTLFTFVLFSSKENQTKDL